MATTAIAGQGYVQDDDSCLVQRAQSKDVEAFQQLFKRHERRVFGLVYRLCHDGSQAEDLTQEVFVQVWQKLGSFRGESKFTTWLHSVATRTAITELRKNQRWYRRLFFADDAMKSGAEPVHEQPADLGELDRLVAKLPEQTRWVFVLHGLEGLRHEEVAQQLGIAVGTSKAQFHRARKMLEEWIEHD